MMVEPHPLHSPRTPSVDQIAESAPRTVAYCRRYARLSNRVFTTVIGIMISVTVDLAVNPIRRSPRTDI